MKGLQDEIAHVVQEQKIKTQGSFFALNGVLKNGKCVLEKSLNFLFKNVYEPRLFFRVIKMMLPCFLLIIVHYYSHTERKLCMYMYSLNKGLQLWDSGLKQKPHQVIQN